MSGIYILYLEGEIVGFSDAPRELDENVDKVVGPISLERVAAVDDLLEACKFLLWLLDEQQKPDLLRWLSGKFETWGDPDEILKMARAAIAKAKGEQT